MDKNDVGLIMRLRRPLSNTKIHYLRAVVVAQLVEQSLLIPEVRGLNPVSGKISKLEKTKIKKNEPRNDQT